MIETRPAARRWTDTDDKLLHDMLKAGLTAEEIGQRLTRTAVSIYSRVQVLDKNAASVRSPRGCPHSQVCLDLHGSRESSVGSAPGFLRTPRLARVFREVLSAN